MVGSDAAVRTCGLMVRISYVCTYIYSVFIYVYIYSILYYLIEKKTVKASLFDGPKIVYMYMYVQTTWSSSEKKGVFFLSKDPFNLIPRIESPAFFFFFLYIIQALIIFFRGLADIRGRKGGKQKYERKANWRAVEVESLMALALSGKSF